MTALPADPRAHVGGPAPAGLPTHRPPAACPVCSTALITLRLGCPSCGTELSGHFDSCRYCRLDSADAAILEVFLRSRGNVRDVQAHLGVSYPTARARMGEVLDRLGLGDSPPPAEPAPPAAAPPAAAPPPAPGTPARGPATATDPGRSGDMARSTETSARGPDPAQVSRVLEDLAAGRLDVDAAEALLAGPD